jgi:hypothetical protein
LGKDNTGLPERIYNPGYSSVRRRLDWYRNGVAYQLKPGDVVVIPAGTGRWFTKIGDHVDYLMVRIDPDKVTPLKSEAQSKEYLSKPAPR